MKIMESRKALIDYVIGNEFISKPELQQKFINLLNKHEKALQLQQTGVSEEEAMKFFIEGYKQRAEKSDLIFDNTSRMYAIHLFKQLKNK